MEKKELKQFLDPEIMKARMMVALNRPRKTDIVLNSLQTILEGKKTIEEAMYSVPRKGGNVTGLSIKIVKDIATIYGHLHYGVRRISEDRKGVDGLAFCLDLQSNTGEEKEFRVDFPAWVLNLKHPEEEKYKSYMSAGVKRERACLEKVIPSFILNKAEELIVKKAKEYAQADLKDQNPKKVLEESLKAFQRIDDRIEMRHLLTRLDTTIEDFSAEKLVLLRKVYTSLSEKISLVQDQFVDLRPKAVEGEFKEVLNDNEAIVKKLGKNTNDPRL